MGFFAVYYDFLLYWEFVLDFIDSAICWVISLSELPELYFFEWQELSEIPYVFPSKSYNNLRETLAVTTFRDVAKKLGEIEEEIMCTVCLNSFEEDDEIRELCNCCHIFHRDCLDKWIDHRQKTCPLCRSSLFPIDHCFSSL
ncbi:hypothetical protein SUGI_1190750 [Cryptomeria japonica]|nr:hypothetical protein SUGI_1190750 [Cryptomeria japonica]